MQLIFKTAAAKYFQSANSGKTEAAWLRTEVVFAAVAVQVHPLLGGRLVLDAGVLLVVEAVERATYNGVDGARRGEAREEL